MGQISLRVFKRFKEVRQRALEANLEVRRAVGRVFELVHSAGGMKSCRLRVISYPVTEKLKRAATLE